MKIDKSSLVKSMTQSHDGIKKARAINLASQIEIAQTNKINGIKQRIFETQNSLDAMNDFAPDSTVSLKAKDVDTTRFVNEIHDLNLQLVELNVELKVAEATYSNWFGEGAGDEEVSDS